MVLHGDLQSNNCSFEQLISEPSEWLMSNPSPPRPQFNFFCDSIPLNNGMFFSPDWLKSTVSIASSGREGGLVASSVRDGG